MKKGIAKLLSIAGMIAILALGTGCEQVKLGGSISGKVVLDETATGNAGFTVSVAGTNYSVVTDDSGSFVIPGVPEGADYSVVVTYQHYYAVAKTGLTVTEGQKTDAGTFNYRTVQIENPNWNWLGDFASEDDIANPKKDDAYYNTTKENSYRYNGRDWEYVGLETEEYQYTQLSRVSYKTTSDGIKFWGGVSGNDSGDNSNYTVSIYNKTTGVSMREDFTMYNYSWSGWEMTYPLVDAGKTYEFSVTVYWHNYSYSNEVVTIEAEGGLGELNIANIDDYTVTLSADKEVTYTKTPEFTKNDKVSIKKTGYTFEIYRTNDKNPKNYYDNTNYLYGFEVFDNDLSNISFNLKDINKIVNWRTYEFLEKYLSGSICGIKAETIVEIAGYTNNNTAKFYMGDTKYSYTDWEGKRNKVFVAYLVRDNNGDISCKYEDKIESENGDVTEYKYSNLPGELVEVTVDGEKFKVYGEYYYYGERVDEPSVVPTYKITYTEKGKDPIVASDYGYGFNFTSWNQTFPCSAEGSEKIKIGEEEVYLMEVYANFDNDSSYRVKAYMNDGTDKLYKDTYINSTYNKTNYDEFLGTPEREGYTFIGWTVTKDGKESEDIISMKPLVLYAQWSKNYKVTVKAGSKTITTVEACADVEYTGDFTNAVEGKIVTGVYTDSALTKPWDGKASKDMTVYLNAKEAKLLWSGNKNYETFIENDNAFTVEAGDILLITVKNTVSYENGCEVYVQDYYRNYGYWTNYVSSVKSDASVVLKLTINEYSDNFTTRANEYGLYVRTNNSNFAITSVSLVKAN